MSRYQVFEISKNGKKIIESNLSLAKAETVSQDMAKTNTENTYGYEPVYEEGVKVGGSYNFLLEGKNNEYDEEYKDYIEVGDVEVDKLMDWQKRWDEAGSNPMNERIFNEMKQEIEELNKALDTYVENDIMEIDGNAILNLLKDETRNLDDSETLSFNVSFVKDIIELIEQKEKKTVAKILAFVEKNHDAPEIEEYLWKMHDKGTEFE